GTFAYSPGAGTVLGAGANQMLTATFTPNDTTHYTIALVAAFITVNPAPLTITADNKSKAFGAPIPSLTASYSGFVNGDGPGSLATRATRATTANANSPAGTYPITVAGATSPNYTIGFVNGTLTITAAGSATALTSSNSPSLFGVPITLTA